MSAINLIGVSVLLYCLVGGYFAYSALTQPQKAPFRSQRLLLATVLALMALLLGWASSEYFR